MCTQRAAMRSIYRNEDSPEILEKKQRVIHAMTARLEGLKKVVI